MSQQRKQRNDKTTDEFLMRNHMVNHELKKQNLKDHLKSHKIQNNLVQNFQVLYPSDQKLHSNL